MRPGAAKLLPVPEILPQPDERIYALEHAHRGDVKPPTSELAMYRFQVLRSWGRGSGFTADVLVIEEAYYSICYSPGEQIRLLR